MLDCTGEIGSLKEWTYQILFAQKYPRYTGCNLQDIFENVALWIIGIGKRQFIDINIKSSLMPI